MTDPDGPYGDSVLAVPPREEVPLDDATPFDCDRDDVRHPRETKGMEYRKTVTNDGPSCGCDDDEC